MLDRGLSSWILLPNVTHACFISAKELECAASWGRRQAASAKNCINPSSCSPHNYFIVIGDDIARQDRNCFRTSSTAEFFLVCTLFYFYKLVNGVSIVYMLAEPVYELPGNHFLGLSAPTGTVSKAVAANFSGGVLDLATRNQQIWHLFRESAIFLKT